MGGSDDEMRDAVADEGAKAQAEDQPMDADSDTDDEDRRPKRTDGDSEPSPPRQRTPPRERSPRRDEPKKEKNPRKNPPMEMIIGAEDAAFLVGTGGKTKDKVARVAGARLDLLDADDGKHRLEIFGKDENRRKAKQYVEWVLRQRVGPITVDTSGAPRDDLSIVSVPLDCVAYVMGKNGVVLRNIEEEYGTLMFFGKPTSGAEEGVEKLMILGSRRSRRGAELKVMSAVEHKRRGFFVDEKKELRKRLEQVGDGEGDGWGYDVFPFHDDEFSYALGAQGSTRKKLAAASGCILEYIGDVAVMAGNRDERRRCWDYLNWLLKQRKGALSVDPKGRDDVLELPVPSGKAGRLSGKGGNVLRSIEKETSTFCFLTDHRAAADGESRDELMLIFGRDKRDRYKAMDLMEDAMEGKYQPKGGGGGGGDRGGRDARGGGDRGGRGGGGGKRSDACHDFSVGRCTRGDKCRFSHDVATAGGTRGGGRSDRDASPRRDGRGGPDRGRGRRDRDRDRDRRGPYGDGRGGGGGSRGGERGGGRDEEAGARPGEDPRYDRR